MRLHVIHLFLAAGLLLTGIAPFVQAKDAVNESQRDIPVAYRTDVVVVGGGTNAVSAAISAAESGAKVFLAAPRPYLGEDMTGTLRLWLEDGETPTSPLAVKIFSDPLGDKARLDTRPRLPYKYRTTIPSATSHPDSSPVSLLSDGLYQNPVNQSIQYDGDVSIDIKLEKSTKVAEVAVLAFVRESTAASDGFGIKTIKAIANGKTLATITEPEPNGQHSDGMPVLFTIPVNQKLDSLRLEIAKADNVTRILLGEVEVIADKTENSSDQRKAAAPMPRPMHVKKTLDEALINAGVTFLYSCYPTDVLRDAKGNVCGIVMANRAGRQAVVAKTIIDATEDGTVAKMAGADFRKASSCKTQTFRRTVIGGEPIEAEGLSHRIINPPFFGMFSSRLRTSMKGYQVIEYTFNLPLNGNVFDGKTYKTSYAALSAADQAARRMTYHPEQQFTSDLLFFIPDQQIISEKAFSGDCSDVANLPLKAFQPKGVDHLYVAGPAADLPRDEVEAITRPLARIDLGTRLGKAAAAEAKALATPQDVQLAGEKTNSPAATGDVAEVLVGVRPTQELKTIPQAARALPVLGEYDVLVIGGGTAGAPAGIAAARAGAKTLVVEYLHGLGGVGTVGAISLYYHGNRVGFTTEIPGNPGWKIEQKMEWYRSELEKANADVWLGSLGCGTFIDKNQVRGAVVVTPQGRGVVLAKVVIDATGNADLAAASGAPCRQIDHNEFAMQGTGLPPRNLGATYTNTDFTFSDETDMLDVWRIFVHAKDKYPEAFDQSRIIDTRERRRVIGDATITILDEINHRTYPDSIVLAKSDFDTHGYTVDPYLVLEHPDRKSIYAYIPYRCLLPRQLEGLLVVGLGISVHRDAIPAVRMQPDIQNQGYAAGRAAAMAVKDDIGLREIDIKALQKHLVEIGNLPKSVLTDKDSYPLPPERIKEAVQSISEGKHAAAVILSHPKQSLPLLKEAYQAARSKGDPSQLGYAKYLCIFGVPEAADAIIEEVRKHKEWDPGWNYRSGGQYGYAMSPLDNLIVLLGYSGSKKALPVILEKAEMLDAEKDFSHHRAVGLALERLGDPRAAETLAKLLSKPDMQGYAHTTLEKVRELDPSRELDVNAIVSRRVSLRELVLARALFRCGDYNGLGEKILGQYANDLRGHIARHAKAVLEETKQQNADSPEAAAEKSVVINAGIGGNNSWNLLARLDKDVLAQKPELVVMLVGSNDVLNSGNSVPLDKYRQNLTQLAQRITDSGSKLVLMTLPPCYETYLLERHPAKFFGEDGPAGRIAKANQIVRQIAEERDIPLVDVNELFTKIGKVGPTKESLMRNEVNAGARDGVHPTPEGYRHIADAILKVIRKNDLPTQHVVCFGDSITFGAHVLGAGTATGATYPAFLSRALNR